LACARHSGAKRGVSGGEASERGRTAPAQQQRIVKSIEGGVRGAHKHAVLLAAARTAAAASRLKWQRFSVAVSIKRKQTWTGLKRRLDWPIMTDTPIMLP
jgi:hypothetical protein